jgi:hypothetical protein
MKAVVDYIIEETKVGVDEVGFAYRTRRLMAGSDWKSSNLDNDEYRRTIKKIHPTGKLNQLAFDPQLTPGGAQCRARLPARAAFGKKSPSSPTKSASRLPPLSFMNWKK